MLFLALFGPPGAGKGTQAKRITEKYHLTHLSTGDLIRKEIELGTQIGIEAAELINKGQLLSDEIVMDMVRHTVSSSSHNGFLFDGFPRTVNQAAMLDLFLKEIGGHVLNGLLSIEVDQEELVRRMLKRAEEEGRSDDSPEVMENRFVEYEKKTLAVATYYEALGRCFTVDGGQSVEQVTEDLVEIIERIK